MPPGRGGLQRGLSSGGEEAHQTLLGASLGLSGLQAVGARGPCCWFWYISRKLGDLWKFLKVRNSKTFKNNVSTIESASMSKSGPGAKSLPSLPWGVFSVLGTMGNTKEGDTVHISWRGFSGAVWLEKRRHVIKWDSRKGYGFPQGKSFNENIFLYVILTWNINSALNHWTSK